MRLPMVSWSGPETWLTEHASFMSAAKGQKPRSGGKLPLAAMVACRRIDSSAGSINGAILSFRLRPFAAAT